MSLFSLPPDLFRFLVQKYLDNLEKIVLRCTCRKARTYVGDSVVTLMRGSLYSHAASKGNVNILEWLLNDQRIRIPFEGIYTHKLCDAAAACDDFTGALKALIWLLDHGANPSPLIAEIAARVGNVEMLNWAISSEIGTIAQPAHYRLRTLLQEAAKSNHKSVVEMLFERNRGSPGLIAQSGM